MLVYSFLTKDFRGGVIWEFSLAAYDQFIFDRGLFGDEPPQIEWIYINIYLRSIGQALLATIMLCLLDRFSHCVLHRHPARSELAIRLAFSHHRALLGEPPDPHGFHEVPDP